MTIRPPRIGFPVQILGRPGLKSHDARRWQSNPHLRVSLQYLRQVFAYLDEVDIRMYRMASGLAPYWTAHAEFADPFAFIEFYRPLADAAPDVILEAKAKDVAVAQLRRDLVRYAPDVAGVFNLAE